MMLYFRRKGEESDAGFDINTGREKRARPTGRTLGISFGCSSTYSGRNGRRRGGH